MNEEINKSKLVPDDSFFGKGKSYTISLHKEEDIENCLDFIKEYRKLEKMQIVPAKDILENIFADEPIHKVDRVIEQWKLKKKDFGSFYLNIDVPLRIKIYNSFGIEDSSDKEYLVKIKNDPRAILFEKQSVTYNRLHNLIVFFNNYGITDNPAEYLKLINTPKFSGRSFDPNDPTFGNTKNWGKYILSLQDLEQKRVISDILNNYQIERYAK